MKVLLICLMTLLISMPSLALSEAEEFELYKEFKAQKSAEKSADESKTAPDAGSTKQNQTEDATDKKDVNVVINNNLAQPSTQKSEANLNAMYYYEEKKKSPFLASSLSFFVPSLGHAYAGNWFRSLPFTIFIGLGAALISDSEEKREECYGSYYNYRCYEETITDTDKQTAGVALLTIAWIWGVVDAADTAKDYNRDLMRGLNLYVDVNRQYDFIAGVQYNF